MRTIHRFCLPFVISASLVAACEHLPSTAEMTPSPSSIRLDVADAHFRLSAAERATVSPIFDADALERLLARIRPDLRREIFAEFQMRHGKNLGRIVEIFDPELQALLEEVWALAWDNATDQEVEDDAYGWPGREVVKQRRARARANGNTQGNTTP